MWSSLTPSCAQPARRNVGMISRRSFSMFMQVFCALNGSLLDKLIKIALKLYSRDYCRLINIFFCYNYFALFDLPTEKEKNRFICQSGAKILFSSSLCSFAPSTTEETSGRMKPQKQNCIIADNNRLTLQREEEKAFSPERPENFSDNFS